MQRIVRTERDEPMRSWDPKRCFVRNENGNVIPGKKDLVATWSHTPFKTWKINSPSRKRRKMDLTDSFSPIWRLLLWACTSGISLKEQGWATKTQPSFHCHPAPASPHWFLLFNPNMIKWLVPEMKKKKKKKASIPAQMQIDHTLASLPTSTANLNVQNSDGISNPEGSKKHPSVVHSLQILPYGLWMYSRKTRVGQSRILKRGQRFRGLSVPGPDVTERLPTDQETKVLR